jgi:hypothetical protein
MCKLLFFGWGSKSFRASVFNTVVMMDADNRQEVRSQYIERVHEGENGGSQLDRSFVSCCL